MPNRFSDLLDDFIEDVGVAVFDITKSIYVLEKGHLTKVRAYGGKTCTETSVVDICGSASTDKSGKRVLKLEDFVCIEYKSPGGGDEYEYLAPPVYFVSTPYSKSPSFLTFTIDIENQEPEANIRITVFSWDSSGQPLANVKFNWHCCIQHVIVSIG